MGYKIISKFIKDISFEIPNAQTFVLLEKEISKYKKKNNVSENIVEGDYEETKQDNNNDKIIK